MNAAAKCYNDRLRSQWTVPVDYTDDWPTVLIFVVADDRCSQCEAVDELPIDDQLDHYCSIDHIAEAFGVDRDDLLETARMLRGLDALRTL